MLTSLLPDRRQDLRAVDHDEIVGAAAIVAVQHHEAGLAPADTRPHCRAGPGRTCRSRRDAGPASPSVIEEFGLAVDFAVLRFGRDDEQRDEEQEGEDLQRLEQHDR